MSTTPYNDAEFFQKKFLEEVNRVSSTNEMLVAYDGLLNPDTIAKLESEIESKILEKNLPKGLVRKVFFICIESLQNMYIHGYKDHEGNKHNFFVLYLNGEKVNMITANLVATAAIEKMTKHIEKINSFDDPAALKAFYLERLENNEISETGAGLGFITICMKSGNKLNTAFESMNDDRSLFKMEVAISA